MSTGVGTREQRLTESPEKGERKRGAGIRRVPLLVWVFLGIPLALELAWVFWPAINSFYISLTDWNGAGEPIFIGFQNFADLFTRWFGPLDERARTFFLWSTPGK